MYFSKHSKVSVVSFLCQNIFSALYKLCIAILITSVKTNIFKEEDSKIESNTSQSVSQKATH